MPRQNRQARSNTFCFTLFGYTQQNKDHLLTSTGPQSIFDYLIFQEETCPTTQALHLQSYCETPRRYTVQSLKTIIAIRTIHLEIRNGTQAEAITYCRKDETLTGQRYTRGTPHRPRGRPRGELFSATLAVKAGVSMRTIAWDYSNAFVKHHQGLTTLRHMIAGERSTPMEIIVYFGTTGTGKSYKAHHDFPNAYKATWPARGGVWWWPNYDGQETVILDEFRHDIKYKTMLKLTHEYAWTIQTKGSHIQFTSKRLVFTTNINPASWYPGVSDVAPLRRRLTMYAKIYHFGPLTWTEDVPPVAVPHFTLQPLAPRPIQFRGYRPVNLYA